jgi:hypothetical protein
MYTRDINEVTIFASQPHTHLKGDKIKTPKTKINVLKKIFKYA